MSEPQRFLKPVTPPARPPGAPQTPPPAVQTTQATFEAHESPRLNKAETHIHRSGFWRGVLYGAIGGLVFAAGYHLIVVTADAINRQWIYERGRGDGLRSADPNGGAALTGLPVRPVAFADAVARDPNPDADAGYQRNAQRRFVREAR